MTYVILPSNYIEFFSTSHGAAILGFILLLELPFRVSNIEIIITANNEDLRVFLATVLLRLQKPLPEATRSLNFSGGKPGPCGRAYADFMMAKHFLKNRESKNLLDIATLTESVSSNIMLTTALTPIAGTKGVKSLSKLPDLLNKIIGELVSKASSRFTEVYNNSTISFGEVIKKCLKHTEEKIAKGKTKAVASKPIHLQRPSNSEYILVAEEKLYLQDHESCWTNIKELSDLYKNGVPIGLISEVRERYSTNYNSTFDINKNFIRARAVRKNCFEKIFVLNNRNKRDTLTITKKKIEELLILALENIFDPEVPPEYKYEVLNALKPVTVTGIRKNRDDYITGRYLEVFVLGSSTIVAKKDENVEHMREAIDWFRELYGKPGISNEYITQIAEISLDRKIVNERRKKSIYVDNDGYARPLTKQERRHEKQLLVRAAGNAPSGQMENIFNDLYQGFEGDDDDDWGSDDDDPDNNRHAEADVKEEVLSPAGNK